MIVSPPGGSQEYMLWSMDQQRKIGIDIDTHKLDPGMVMPFMDCVIPTSIGNAICDPD